MRKKAAKAVEDTAEDVVDAAESTAEQAADAATGAAATGGSAAAAGAEIAGAVIVAAVSVSAAAAAVAAEAATGVGAVAGGAAVAAVAVAIAGASVAVAAGITTAVSFVALSAAIAAFQAAAGAAAAATDIAKVRAEISRAEAAIRDLLNKVKELKAREDEVKKTAGANAARSAIIANLEKAANSLNDLLRAAADAGVPASPVTEVQFRNLDSVASKVFTSFTLKIPPIPGKSAALANLQQMKAQFQSAARNFAAIQAAAKQTATQPVTVQNPGLPKVSAI